MANKNMKIGKENRSKNDQNSKLMEAYIDTKMKIKQNEDLYRNIMMK